MIISPRMTIAAGLALLPALLFVSANVLKYELGVPEVYDALAPIAQPAPDLVGDAIVLLGPLVALAIVAASAVRVSIQRTAGAVTGSITVAVGWPVIAFGAASLSLLAVMGGYVVAENLPCILGKQLVC